ncbi:hypothetical protein CATMIT_01629, partial [Catenibacterium mitsuokai DSM 15897]
MDRKIQVGQHVDLALAVRQAGVDIGAVLAAPRRFGLGFGVVEIEPTRAAEHPARLAAALEQLHAASALALAAAVGGVQQGHADFVEHRHPRLADALAPRRGAHDQMAAARHPFQQGLGIARGEGARVAVDQHRVARAQGVGGQQQALARVDLDPVLEQRQLEHVQRI